MNMKKVFFTGIVLVVLVSLGLNACNAGKATPTPTPVDVQAIYTAAMQTAIAQATLDAPTATATATVTSTPTITPMPTITPTPTPLVLSLETNIAIYMAYPTDQENCKYLTIPFAVNRAKTGDMVNDIRLALGYLLNTKWQSSGSLTNLLSASNMQFSRIDVSGTSMNIYLTGTAFRSDDSCLNSEARDQVWATVSRYADPSLTITIWVDNLFFDDLMLNG
jgi:hypothetical protein